MDWDSEEPVEKSQYTSFQAISVGFFYLIIAIMCIEFDWYFASAMSVFCLSLFFSLSYACAGDGYNRRMWEWLDGRVI